MLCAGGGRQIGGDIGDQHAATDGDHHARPVLRRHTGNHGQSTQNELQLSLNEAFGRELHLSWLPDRLSNGWRHVQNDSFKAARELLQAAEDGFAADRQTRDEARE